MLFTTPTQFAVLGLVLVAGWLLGLASRSGGARWKERYATEREAHAAARRDADARAAEAENRHAEALRVARERAAAAPVAVAPVTTRSPTLQAARPAYPAGERRGWFDFGRPAAR